VGGGLLPYVATVHITYYHIEGAIASFGRWWCRVVFGGKSCQVPTCVSVSTWFKKKVPKFQSSKGICQDLWKGF